MDSLLLFLKMTEISVDIAITVDEQKYRARLYFHSDYGTKHPGTPPNKEGKFE